MLKVIALASASSPEYRPLDDISDTNIEQAIAYQAHPRFAVALGVDKQYYKWLILIRGASIIPCISGGLQCLSFLWKVWQEHKAGDSNLVMVSTLKEIVLAVSWVRTWFEIYVWLSLADWKVYCLRVSILSLHRLLDDKMARALYTSCNIGTVALYMWYAILFDIEHTLCFRCFERSPDVASKLDLCSSGMWTSDQSIILKSTNVLLNWPHLLLYQILGGACQIIRRNVKDYREFSASMKFVSIISFITMSVLLQDIHAQRPEAPWKRFIDWTAMQSSIFSSRGDHEEGSQDSAKTDLWLYLCLYSFFIQVYLYIFK